MTDNETHDAVRQIPHEDFLALLAEAHAAKREAIEDLSALYLWITQHRGSADTIEFRKLVNRKTKLGTGEKLCLSLNNSAAPGNTQAIDAARSASLELIESAQNNKKPPTLWVRLFPACAHIAAAIIKACGDDVRLCYVLFGFDMGSESESGFLSESHFVHAGKEETNTSPPEQLKTLAKAYFHKLAESTDTKLAEESSGIRLRYFQSAPVGSASCCSTRYWATYVVQKCKDDTHKWGATKCNSPQPTCDKQAGCVWKSAHTEIRTKWVVGDKICETIKPYLDFFKHLCPDGEAGLPADLRSRHPALR